jgi:hypothetical protein
VTIILGGDSLNKTVSPKKQDAKYLFLFHYPDYFFIGRRDVRVWQPCRRSWREPWSCIIHELDVKARAYSTVRQIELEVWQSTTRWRTSIDNEESRALRMIWSCCFQRIKNWFPEERYHRQQEHVERDKSLSHQQSRKILGLGDTTSSTFGNIDNWCLLTWERWLGECRRGRQCWR